MNKLMTGNEAIAEAAVRAGCRCYFAYPITPQNEIGEYLSWRLPEEGGCFLQAESEVAAIYMVFGAASAGARAMTSSSSPGISLMQEGISYLAAAELPCVIVNMMRGGPGLGSLQPSQSDYFQATKGGGHGDYRLIVLAPHTCQEAVELTALAFELADKYRTPVMLLGDGNIGQMMEPVEFGSTQPPAPANRPWAVTGARDRPRNLIKTLYLDPYQLEKHNVKLNEKFMEMARETRHEEYLTDDAEIVIVAYGTVARIARTAIALLREQGLKVGLLRPISLYPFPNKAFERISRRVKHFLVVEMSMGQMVEDVRLAVNGRSNVHFYGRTGGVVPTYEEIASKAEEVWRRANSL